MSGNRTANGNGHAPDLQAWQELIDRPIAGQPVIPPGTEGDVRAGMIRGYCVGLELGHYVGLAEGSGLVYTHSDNPPPQYLAIVNRHLSYIDPTTNPAANPAFDKGFVYQMKFGYLDGYKLGHEIGVLKVDINKAMADGDPELTEFSAEQSSIISQYTSIKLKWCPPNLSMDLPSAPASVQTALTTATSQDAPYPPELAAALSEMWQRVKADGYISSGISNLADEGTNFEASATESIAATGANAKSIAQAANALASVSEAEGSQAKGMANQASEDAQTKAEAADAAASA